MTYHCSRARPSLKDFAFPFFLLFSIYREMWYNKFSKWKFCKLFIHHYSESTFSLSKLLSFIIIWDSLVILSPELSVKTWKIMKLALNIISSKLNYITDVWKMWIIYIILLCIISCPVWKFYWSFFFRYFFHFSGNFQTWLGKSYSYSRTCNSTGSWRQRCFSSGSYRFRQDWSLCTSCYTENPSIKTGISQFNLNAI